MPTFFLNLLNNYENKAIIYKYHKFALVAQLDRVFGYETYTLNFKVIGIKGFQGFPSKFSPEIPLKYIFQMKML